mgnify:CR=1 FL=1
MSRAGYRRCALSIHCFMDDGHEGRCRDAAMTADGKALDPMFLRLVMRDGDEIVYGRCPGCGEWAELDDDQLHGRVSTHHDPGCGYHETKDWWADHAA